MTMVMNIPLWTKYSGLYKHREGLRLHKVGYKGKESTYSVAQLAFHAKESPIRTRVQSLVFVSPQPISLPMVNRPDARGPLSPGLP